MKYCPTHIVDGTGHKVERIKLYALEEIGQMQILPNHKNPDCKDDHGERTNRKLTSQPFYARGRNGKMRNY